MRKKWLFGCGIPVLLIGAITLYGYRSLTRAETRPQPFETVTRGDVEDRVVETGTIEPLRKVEVKSKAGGRVLKLLVDEGARVRAGQVIALVDPQEIDSQVAAIKAQLQGSGARLASARKGVNLQKDQTRTTIDQCAHAVEAALAKVKEAEEDSAVQPKLTGQSVAMAQANLDSATASLKALRDNLDLMTQSVHPQAVIAAQAAFDQAEAQATNSSRNLARQKQLCARGFVPQQTVDTAETDTRVAISHKSEVEAALRRINQTNLLEETNLRSQIAAAESQVRQQSAALDSAMTNIAPSEKQRELESALAAYRQAAAQLEAARAGRTQDSMKQDDVTAAEADLRNIDNQLKQVQVQQADTTLFAPMTGIVTKRYVEEGEIIMSAIASVSSGSPVFQIADLSSMLIKIRVNEVDISRIRAGLPTEVTSDALKGVVVPARVKQVSPSALAADGSTAGQSSNGQAVVRFPVQILIDHANARLMPGMSARCKIVVARRRNVLRLPVNCIEGSGREAAVQLVTSMVRNGRTVETVSSRKVALGIRGDDFVEIVSGLSQGDRVRPNPYTGPPRKEIDLGGNNNS